MQNSTVLIYMFLKFPVTHSIKSCLYTGAGTSRKTRVIVEVGKKEAVIVNRWSYFRIYSDLCNSRIVPLLWRIHFIFLPAISVSPTIVPDGIREWMALKPQTCYTDCLQSQNLFQNYIKYSYSHIPFYGCDKLGEANREFRREA